MRCCSATDTPDKIRKAWQQLRLDQQERQPTRTQQRLLPCAAAVAALHVPEEVLQQQVEPSGECIKRLDRIHSATRAAAAHMYVGRCCQLFFVRCTPNLQQTSQNTLAWSQLLLALYLFAKCVRDTSVSCHSLSCSALSTASALGATSDSQGLSLFSTTGSSVKNDTKLR